MHVEIDRAIELHSEAAFAFLEAMVREQSVAGAEQSAMAVFEREAQSVGLIVDRLPLGNGPLADPRAGIAPPAQLMTSDRYQVLAVTPGGGELRARSSSANV